MMRWFILVLFFVASFSAFSDEIVCDASNLIVTPGSYDEKGILSFDFEKSIKFYGEKDVEIFAEDTFCGHSNLTNKPECQFINESSDTVISYSINCSLKNNLWFAVGTYQVTKSNLQGSFTCHTRRNKQIRYKLENCQSR